MQMAHLGRAAPTPLPVIAQKWLTGHPKGSAFAWMLNGAVQAMNSGMVPGNKSGAFQRVPLFVFFFFV